VVLAGVFGINMFFPSSQLAEAAGESHSLRWSQQAIGWLGEAVDDDLRSVLALQPLGGQPGSQDPKVPGAGQEKPLEGGNGEPSPAPAATAPVPSVPTGTGNGGIR